ncbi:hypothetical protein M501DRAFT_925505 [Patellaria atrata CBS 101060]|uniref:C2H2-type domain-containing protein n=1 Tax=Patellaria atrata CBS 101060 TaxID=1346257 RepID=A0A9P4SJG7_9PEZI|nr:hypothetical protein M501DRAFT_925505 [Patellaria atrata CBS 101060]
MATSTRAVTPTHTGSFLPSNATPNTPISISSTSQPPGAPAPTDQGLPKQPQISFPQEPFDPAVQPISAKTQERGLSPRYSPQPLTGAAAMADQRKLRDQRAHEGSRQTSPNPAANALNALLGNPGMSKTNDAPNAITKMSEPLARVSKAISIPDNISVDNMQTSPVSMSSFGSVDTTTAPTVTASETAIAGPQSLHNILGENNGQQPAAGPSSNPPEDQPSNRAFTFPGPVPPEQDAGPSRGMSLPMPGYPQSTPRSPTTRRHKCPYCSTDFTRHHNLKSHLLTHSQEKPFECPTCQARFRRLHDLKRHTKLHTGERPHTCPKCGRRFARGDALARHNKGQGGCAGRRASFGGVDEEGGEGKEEGMEGLMYHGQENDDDENMEDDNTNSGRRVSEPAHKHPQRQGSTSTSYNQHGSTYPPVAGNRMLGNNLRPMYPPSTSAASSRDQSSTLSPNLQPGSSMASVHFSAGQSAGVYAQGGMTESPKPLSPGQTDNRLGVPESGSVPGARSPNMQHQLHPSQYSRGAGRGSSPMGLPPPSVNTSNVPHLPSLPGLSPSDPRISIPKSMSNPPPQANMSGIQHHPNILHQQPGQSGPTNASNPGSLSSHSHAPSSGGSMREVLGARAESDLWAYVRDIEARLARTQDEVNRLQNEVASLKEQQQPQQQGR